MSGYTNVHSAAGSYPHSHEQFTLYPGTSEAPKVNFSRFVDGAFNSPVRLTQLRESDFNPSPDLFNLPITTTAGSLDSGEALPAPIPLYSKSNAGNMHKSSGKRTSGDEMNFQLGRRFSWSSRQASVRSNLESLISQDVGIYSPFLLGVPFLEQKNIPSGVSRKEGGDSYELEGLLTTEDWSLFMESKFQIDERFDLSLQSPVYTSIGSSQNSGSVNWFSTSWRDNLPCDSRSGDNSLNHGVSSLAMKTLSRSSSNTKLDSCAERKSNISVSIPSSHRQNSAQVTPVDSRNSCDMEMDAVSSKTIPRANAKRTSSLVLSTQKNLANEALSLLRRLTTKRHRPSKRVVRARKVPESDMKIGNEPDYLIIPDISRLTLQHQLYDEGIDYDNNDDVELAFK